MAELHALRDHIIFQFEREVVRKTDNGYERTQFQDETDWGFQVSNFDEGTQQPQWGIVTSVGPDATDIELGDRVLIEALKWSHGIEVDGKTFWRTDETQVMAIDDTYH